MICDGRDGYRMTTQTQLSIKTHKTEDYKPREHPHLLLNWKAMKNHKLKKYLLVQVIQAITEQTKNHLSIKELSTIINRNTVVKSQNRKGIVKKQLIIYIENLIYYGFLDNSYSRGLVLNDKIYDEIEATDGAIREANKRSKP